MWDLLATIGFAAAFVGFATWMWTLLRKAEAPWLRWLGHVYFVMCWLAALAIVLGSVIGPYPAD